MQSISFSRVLSFVWSYYRRFPLTVGLAYLAMTVMIAAELAHPLITGLLIDTITIDHSPQRFERAFLLVFLSVGQGVLFNLALRSAHFLNCYTDSHVQRLIGAETLNHVQHLSSDWHANSFSGSTVTKIRRAMRAAHNFYDSFCYEFYPAAGILIGQVVLIALRQPTLGLFFGIFATLYATLSIWLAMSYVTPANRQANREDSTMGGALADMLTSNATVKAFAGERREFRYFEKISTRWRQVAARSWVRGNVVALIQSLVNNGMKLLLVLGAVWLWTQGKFTPGDVVFIFSSYQLLGVYLRSIGDRVRDLNQAINDMEDVIELWSAPELIHDRKGAGKLVVDKGEVVVEQINFRYPNQTHDLFHDFSLRVKAGEKLALVGASGSGKSTFVKLIQRLYDLQGGRILIDGQDISGVTQRSLRASIGLVPQDPILFHRSLADNIAYGQPKASRAQIVAAAKKAHANEFIEKFPQGYDTLVGERGVKLSGGERQRVAIARAILADSPILILDEATSSLDSKSEKLIQEALANLLRGRTAIMIAHRLSTITSADRILVFDQGRIVEEGNHQELVKKKKGVYRHLYELQAGGFL